MKNKKIRLVVIAILLLLLLSIDYTYSRLNITFKYDMAFNSKGYIPLTITKTSQVEDNSYQISLENDNNYEITFSCEDINSNFDVTCSTNKISANSATNITVDVDLKSDVDTSTLTPNPNGSGYITKLGIRIISPYNYPKNDPHYIESGNMIVIELTITNLVEYITALASTDTTNLASDHSNIRYIGANPKNYISFNNELWRIIGVFDGKIKIIRVTPYNNTPYTFYDGSASGINTKFENATLKIDLNNTFYYTINQKYRSMIKEETWNVGGLNTWSWQVAGTAYTNEKSATIKSNVGLISATDYVYAIGGSNRTTCIESKHIGEVSSCSSDNWLFPYASTSGMWTINEFTGTTGYTLVVDKSGNIAPNGIQYTASAYPVIYLDESMGFTSGDGRENNPFKLKTGSGPVISNNYKDYITNVYLNSWGNELSGFAGKEITSFDKDGGALLFANETWGIPSEYTIDQVTVYSYNWKELATYYQRTWIEDNTWHARLSNYVFKRHIAPDLDYIGGSDTLEQSGGTLRFLIIVKN